MTWTVLKPFNKRHDTPSMRLALSPGRGILAWNGATDKLLGIPSHVDVLFNRELGLLGIRASSQTEDTFKVSRTKSRYGVSIRGGAYEVGLVDATIKPRKATQMGDIVYIDASELFPKDGTP